MVVLGALVAGIGLLSGCSGDDDDVGADTGSVPPVDVIELSGLLDPVTVDFVTLRLDTAAENGAQALIIQLNSKDAVVSEDDVAALAEHIENSPVPVGVWVGPSGARAYGPAGQLLGVADVSGVSPGSRVGRFGPLLEVNGRELTFGAATDELRRGTFGAPEARDAGVLRRGSEVNDRQTATLGEFYDVLDGVEAKGRTLDTTDVVGEGDEASRQPIAPARFYKLELLPRLMHTVASPPVAYLLFAVGLVLLVFEFFTAGVGVAGVVGAGSLVFAAYGLATLPARPWAVTLIVVSALAFAIDVQTGVPRFWTGVGIATFVFGSVFLYDGLSLSWLTLVVGIAGVLLAFGAGMPAMVRARFATPTIGRDWMVGEVGVADGPVDPDGVVEVQGARWRARTNRATPITDRGRVRVVAITGTTLEVEPESGGARDYRERRSKHE